VPKAEAKAESKAEPKIESRRTEPKAEPVKTDTKAKAAKTQAAAAPEIPAPKVEPTKPAAAPKLAFTSGPALKIKTRRKKERPVAQLSMRVTGWPAKFTKMWRVRINRK
jgi:hypothetical protein